VLAAKVCLPLVLKGLDLEIVGGSGPVLSAFGRFQLAWPSHDFVPTLEAVAMGKTLDEQVEKTGDKESHPNLSRASSVIDSHLITFFKSILY